MEFEMTFEKAVNNTNSQVVYDKCCLKFKHYMENIPMTVDGHYSNCMFSGDISIQCRCHYVRYMYPTYLIQECIALLSE